MTENNVNFCYTDGKYLFLFMRKACLWLKYEFLSVFKLPYPFTTPPPKKQKRWHHLSLLSLNHAIVVTINVTSITLHFAKMQHFLN